MPRTLPRVATCALTAAVLFLAACGDDHDDSTRAATTGAAATGATPTTVAATQTTVAATTGASAATAATTTVAGTLVEVAYKGGKVEGGGRKQVAKGQTVTLRITSDVADEVHLHGYDKEAALVPGTPTDVVFKADASGVFEVELHKKGLKLVEIEVR